MLWAPQCGDGDVGSDGVTELVRGVVGRYCSGGGGGGGGIAIVVVECGVVGADDVLIIMRLIILFLNPSQK